MCATCLSVYECYVRACACGERGPTGQIKARQRGRPHRATKVEGRERNKTRKTRRAISSRRLAGLRHPRKISLHQFSTVQSGRIRQENSEVRALRMVFLRNALLRLHHRRRWRRTTGSETRETASRAEPREEEIHDGESQPRGRARVGGFTVFSITGNLRESESVCVSSSTTGRARRGGSGRKRGEPRDSVVLSVWSFCVRSCAPAPSRTTEGHGRISEERQRESRSERNAIERSEKNKKTRDAFNPGALRVCVTKEGLSSADRSSEKSANNAPHQRPGFKARSSRSGRSQSPGSGSVAGRASRAQTAQASVRANT